MTQTEFTRRVAIRAGMSILTTEEFISAFTYWVTRGLRRGSLIDFFMFASFYVTKTLSRLRFDVNGLVVKQMPAKNIVKMRIHRSLFRTLNPTTVIGNSGNENGSFDTNIIRLLINSSRTKDKIMTNQFLQAFFGEIIRNVKLGDIVTINNLGSFYVAISAARNGRNPRTGATIFIPARNRLKFIASDKLKAAVN